MHEDNVIADGDHSGLALKQLAASHAVELLGARTLDRTGKRFPLLIKLLDPADWLSLQVHPNDEQAKRLEWRKLFWQNQEAWHILVADPNAQLIAGLSFHRRTHRLRR